ncbi:hypothetical protein KN63_08375 [Smithella sp. F21]|jgi:hypothetical protein|nr:hypothetical protein KN63_08375 [Smithella sp. F21]HBJ74582.1 hypothetical protein [Syntrophaceae bacterium]
MVKNSHVWREFEDAYARQEGPIPPEKAFRIFAAMWEEATRLGKIPFSDPMEGIETDVKIARILNSCLNNESAQI